MDTTERTYPVFEANQVLTNTHLNDSFEYLDEQVRLSRANLVGIGIACGLDVRHGTGSVKLSAGTAVTSHGYLIVEPRDLELGHVRPYKSGDGYAPFVGTATGAHQIGLWELFEDDDEPGATPLATAGLVLDDLAVALFVELRKDDLRNCTRNSCDDRGAQMTVTVRRLLVDVDDLDRIAARSGSIDNGLDGVAIRVALPELRMPRFDVPNTGPVTAQDVLMAFQEPFRDGSGLVARTATALSGLYTALRPLLVDLVPNDPFAAPMNRFRFLAVRPATTAQARFMQYYWDFFDDVIAAYDELRASAVELLCACCPPDGVFSRHVVAGVLNPARHDPVRYRHEFLRSAAVDRCEDRVRAVRQLFLRLVAMIERFDETPPNRGVRVTPSRTKVALSEKAIPYYYDNAGPRALHELWDPARTAAGRANLNLGYRSDEYIPPPPRFVTEPLQFDLERFDFLRVEGHLGRNVHTVLAELLGIVRRHRLPVEVVAMRADAFDENITIDLTKEQCRFEDLETLYDAVVSEVGCSLANVAQFVYDIPRGAATPGEVGEPRLALLRRFAPGFRVKRATVGELIETILGRPTFLPFLFFPLGPPDIAERSLALVRTMSALMDRLGADVANVDVDALRTSAEQLREAAANFETTRRDGVVNNWPGYTTPGLAERLDDVLYRCRVDPFESLVSDYRRRVRDVKQSQHLSHFLERHPGVQHKAGVPVGGTFVLVYHDTPQPPLRIVPINPLFPIRPIRPIQPIQPIRPITPVVFRPAAPALPDDAADSGLGFAAAEETTAAGISAVTSADASQVLAAALASLKSKPQLAADPDIVRIYQTLTGEMFVPKVPPAALTARVYNEAVAELADGAVVADFFLPYHFCAGCTTVQYTLQPAPLRLSLTKSCTNADGFADVTAVVEGASGALSVKLDGGGFTGTSGTFPLAVGAHTVVVRDATGNESAAVAITIPPQLKLGVAEVSVDTAAGTWRLAVAIQGGTAPYRADVGVVADAMYTSPTMPADAVVEVAITDAAGCRVSGRFESGAVPCTLPCNGVALRRGFRFWLPEARPNLPITEYRAEVTAFSLIDQAGRIFDLTAEVNEAVNRTPAVIRTNEFAALATRWLTGVNRAVANTTGSDEWLRGDSERAEPGATTGVLMIDRIVCVDFDLRMIVTFQQGRRARRLELLYNSSGTVFVEPETGTKLRIPAFDGSTSNKCRPNDPPVPICQGTDLQLEIRRDGRIPNELFFDVAVSGSEQPTEFLWEFQDGIPAVAGGERAVVRFDPAEPVEKLVRVTAFTEKGCTVSVERLINVANPD